MQQLQHHQITAEGVHHGGDGVGVLQVSPGRGVGQQQVVAHHFGEDVDIGGPQPQSISDLGGQLRADDAVVAAAPLADVVHQRTEDQEIRPGHPGREGACPRYCFDEVTIDRPDVHHVAGR